MQFIQFTVKRPLQGRVFRDSMTLSVIEIRERKIKNILSLIDKIKV